MVPEWGAVSTIRGQDWRFRTAAVDRKRELQQSFCESAKRYPEGHFDPPF